MKTINNLIVRKVFHRTTYFINTVIILTTLIIFISNNCHSQTSTSRKVKFSGGVSYVPIDKLDKGIRNHLFGSGYGGQIGFIFGTNDDAWTDKKIGVYIYDHSINLSYYKFQEKDVSPEMINLFYSGKYGLLINGDKKFPLYLLTGLGASFIDSNDENTTKFYIEFGLGVEISVKNTSIFIQWSAIITDIEGVYVYPITFGFII